MWIMIAGPYRHGSSDPEQWAKNLQLLNDYAYLVHQKGHVPVIGVNAALPIIEQAGQEHYSAIMMPISLALAERCDAVLRVGGPSKGADQEVALFKKKGLPIYTDVAAIPTV